MDADEGAGYYDYYEDEVGEEVGEGDYSRVYRDVGQPELRGEGRGVGGDLGLELFGGGRSGRRGGHICMPFLGNGR